MAVERMFNLRAARVLPILFEAMAAFASVIVKNNAAKARSKAAC